MARLQDGGTMRAYRSEVRTMLRRHRRSLSHPLGLPLIAGLAFALAFGGAAVTAPPAAAASYSVRLEAGPQTGHRFSSEGVILGRKTVTLAAPTTATAGSRTSVPNQPGTWYRMTSGALAGYMIRESMVAHVPGKIGELVFGSPVRITFAPGRYLGYTFDSSWDLATTRRGTVTATTTATASRRAVIDGRPYMLMSSGTWSGLWMPITSTGAKTAQWITCSVPAKVSPGSAVVYSRVSTTDRQIALTFDMGGRMTPALDIMERLVLDRVCATIFPTGDAAVTTEGKAVMALIKAHPELFEVANHTQNHCNLRDGGVGSSCPAGPPSTSRIQAELLDAEAVIKSLTGRSSVPYWRPPYGAHDSRVRTAAAAVNFTKTIMWDIDTIDWKATADGGPTAGSMVTKVTTNARTGSIVLMHLGGWHTYDALPAMVQRLRAGNLDPTTITALLRAG